MDMKEQAISEYTQAISINQDFAIAYHNRGMAFYDQGKYDQSIIDFSAAIEIDAGYLNAYYHRGKSYSKLGQQEKAASDYKTALSLCGDDQSYCQEIEEALHNTIKK
jgi:tetratricopeptide (TPR) repeat protein